jgi:glutamate carboxypeptidase
MSSILARISARPGMTIASDQMLKIASPFDANIIRDGIRRWVEIETPTEAPEAMNDLKRGVTVNVGVIRGGSKPNVIAEEAYAEVDMCVPTIADDDELVPRIVGPRSRIDGVTVKMMGEPNRPPYEKGNAGLFEHARTPAAEIGLDLVDTSTRGGSDGNFTAPHTATLDGLGVEGKGAHIHYEQMYISSIEPRTRLLHRLHQMPR